MVKFTITWLQYKIASIRWKVIENSRKKSKLIIVILKLFIICFSAGLVACVEMNLEHIQSDVSYVLYYIAATVFFLETFCSLLYLSFYQQRNCIKLANKVHQLYTELKVCQNDNEKTFTASDVQLVIVYFEYLLMILYQIYLFQYDHYMKTIIMAALLSVTYILIEHSLLFITYTVTIKYFIQILRRQYSDKFRKPKQKFDILQIEALKRINNGYNNVIETMALINMLFGIPILFLYFTLYTYSTTVYYYLRLLLEVII